MVQSLFDGLPGTFSRLISMGATTTFEVSGLRRQIRYITSFSACSSTGGLGAALRARTIPRITRFDERWRWLEVAVVPRSRRLDAEMDWTDRTLRHVVERGKRYADLPCLVPSWCETELESPPVLVARRITRAAP